MKFYSHPEKLLKVHLKEVFDFGKGLIDKKLNDIYKIIAYSHDFGKYTTYFQSHLVGSNNVGELSNHSYISSLFGSYISKLRGFSPMDSLLIYSVINNHHGNIENISKKLYKEIDIDKSKVLQQIDNMRDNHDDIATEMQELGLDEFDRFIKEFNYDEHKEYLKSSVYGIKKSTDFELYFKHQKLYSALIYSDKLSAAKIKEPKEKYISFKKLIKEYEHISQGAVKSEVNNLRTKVFYEVQNSINELNKEDKILTITSPTGSGKTYAGFYAAQKIKEKFLKNKIIYALPFTSIIDQNYLNIKNLLEKEKDFGPNESLYIIKHHYLSSVEYKNDFENYLNSQAELLIEGWNSGIIITTFVQLFESIISNKNRYLKKLNQLKNSVIILDEIQAIDIKYYKLIEIILKEISEKFNSHIIIMTATKPIILSDAKELLPNNQKYFEAFNRVQLNIDLTKRNIEEICFEIREKRENNSLLVITNTINESLEIYKKVKDESTYYLSTNLLPIHRKERIEKIKKKLEYGQKLTLISTQILEAGVDIDFDIVIRDIAQIDSIIQASGRCNRNSTHKNMGNVLIRKIVNETGNPYASFVYSNTALQITELLLAKYNTVDEKDFKGLIEEYYRLIKENISFDESENYLTSLKKLDFDNENYGINSFSLIKDNRGYLDVFVIINKDARYIYDEYFKITQIKDFIERTEKYLQLKPLLNQYMLSIPLKYSEIIKAAMNKRFIPALNEIEAEEYYDFEIGLKRPGKEEFLIL